MLKCKEIIKSFCMEEEIINVEYFGTGHVNDTYRITCPKNKYILQRINHKIFKNPYHVMDNIINICNHLKEKVTYLGGNTEREILNFIPTVDGKYVAEYEGNYYRMYIFLDNAITYQSIEDPIHFYNAGKAFGKFQNMLSDFDADKLYETIANFHDTKDRFNNLMIAFNNNKDGRKDIVKDEIDFVLKREDKCSIIVDLLKERKIPLRVTHNDTKLNNVLIDSKTGEAMCVIDLDTVMPSSLLCDFGDAIRFGASTGDEDEKDLSKVNLDINLFEKFSQGFLTELKDSITLDEVNHLAISAQILTLECGIRFLTDYLEGDVYFKTSREGQNLDRARTQFKLVADMEKHEEEMNNIIKNIYNNL
ncbi:MAG: mucin desulfatase [Ruminococcaceae bacterium]|nr:mucin desulfatase [Oscillospiraceae bacterium]